MIKKIFLFGLFVLFIYGTLNYSGFCFKQMRYLSNDDKKRIAAELVSSGQYRTYTSYFSDNGTGKSNRWEKVLPYKSIDEFYYENPKCCTLIPTEIGYRDDLTPPTFWQRIFGKYNYAVLVNAKYKYITGSIDSNKKEIIGHEIKRSGKGHFTFDNCGNYCGSCGGT